jgi:hypothetical protein
MKDWKTGYEVAVISITASYILGGLGSLLSNSWTRFDRILEYIRIEVGDRDSSL